MRVACLGCLVVHPAGGRVGISIDIGDRRVIEDRHRRWAWPALSRKPVDVSDVVLEIALDLETVAAAQFDLELECPIATGDGMLVNKLLIFASTIARAGYPAQRGVERRVPRGLAGTVRPDDEGHPVVQLQRDAFEQGERGCGKPSEVHYA